MAEPTHTVATKGHSTAHLSKGRAIFVGLDETVQIELRGIAEENARVITRIRQNPERKGLLTSSGEPFPEMPPVSDSSRKFPAVENQARELLEGRGIKLQAEEITSLSSYLMISAFGKAQQEIS